MLNLNCSAVIWSEHIAFQLKEKQSPLLGEMHRQAAEAVVCYIALCSKNESSLLFWIIFASFSSAAKRKSFTFSGLCVCVLTAHLREVNECYFLPLCKQESLRTQTTAPWYVHLLVPDIECCCIPSGRTHTHTLYFLG